MPQPPEIPEDFVRLLLSVDAGRVLDVCTGVGQFVQILSGRLGAFDEIFGIDSHEKALEHARANFDDARIRFESMDAAAMTYADDSFQTVAIANSLHHLEDRTAVLSEMRRVLAPGGTWIIMEMHADAPHEASRVALDLHLWAAAMDRACGTYHAPVVGRQELILQVETMGLQDLRTAEWASDFVNDSPETIEHTIQAIDQARAKLADIPESDGLSAKADRLIERIRTHGIGQQPFLLFVGRLGRS